MNRVAIHRRVLNKPLSYELLGDTLILSVIVFEHCLCDIQQHEPFSVMVMLSIPSALQQWPEALDSVRVDLTVYILFRVLDYPVVY